MSNLTINKDIVLNNGVEIPRIGFGTYLMKGQEAIRSVELALEAGYRHIDTAALYGNEEEIGIAIRNSGLNRDDIFITSKVWNEDQGYESTLEAIDVSLDKLGTDFVDLYLVHWPLPEKREATWEAMIELYDERKARSIGVSNYTEKHIDELMKKSSITPVVNQIEISPFLYQKSLADKCESYDIKIEAHTPLVRGRQLENPILAEISKKYEKTPAQLLIRWSLQKGFIVLPKSSNETRIKENFNVFDFEISAEEIEIIDSLDKKMRVSWDPSELD